MYDTSTATKLASASYGLPGDLDYWEETLYRKRNGEYYLYCEGGARSKYSIALSYNSWCGSNDIVPITEADAKQWVEQHCNGDTNVDIFGFVDE